MNAKGGLPRTLRPLVEGYRWRPVNVGQSGAEVYRLTRKGTPPLFLKHARANGGPDLRDEIARLRWLGGRAPVPGVIAVASEDNREWLLMTALAGTNAGASRVSPAAKVRAIAGALRALHALDADDCPFDEGLDSKLARAAENVRQGLVEEDQFDCENAGRKAADLFAELLSKRPASEDVVVTHGDACFDNLMLDGNGFSGFVDCGRAGRADRYQDLALASRSIAYELGEAWIAPFLQHYGLASVDGERLAFYRLLDEFF